jgi:CBS-domain-containing membrane protein
MKWVIAEENPTLSGFAENKWADALAYEDRSAAEAVELIDLTRKQMASILKTLPESAFARTGMHSENGRITLSDIVTKAVKHFDHHLKFIHSKRIKMGKEMW